MIEYIITVLIILIVWTMYTCVIRPKRQHTHYVGVLRNLGYKVHALPFASFRFPFLQILLRDAQEGDPLKFWKTVCANNDVMVGNAMNSVALDISHPDFIKDFYSNEHLYTYPKAKLMTVAIERALGKGIPLSEG